MTPEERVTHIETLLLAATRQVETMELSLGQAVAVVEYLTDALRVSMLAIKPR